MYLKEPYIAGLVLINMTASSLYYDKDSSAILKTRLMPFSSFVSLRSLFGDINEFPKLEGLVFKVC